MQKKYKNIKFNKNNYLTKKSKFTNRCHFDNKNKIQPTNVILIKIWTKIILWRPKSCFKRLNPNPNIKKSALKNLLQIFESRNLNPDFDLINFQSSNHLPSDITNR